MKHPIACLGFAIVAAVALHSLALGQTVPEQFVVRGKAAEKIQDFTTINLATAQRIARGVSAWSRQRRWRHSIIVLDNDGNHVYFDRMDARVIPIS